MPVRKKRKTQDLDFQMGFYEKILLGRPDFIDALIALGEIYTKKGFYEKGLELDMRLARLRPDNPTVHYNLACSFSLTGDVGAALHAIEDAIRLGYDDLSFMNKDPDLENVRKDARYQRLLQGVQRKKAVIQDANTRQN